MFICTARSLFRHSNLESQRFSFFRADLKHEILRETLAVALNGFVEVERFDLVEFRQIAVEHDLLAANKIDLARPMNSTGTGRLPAEVGRGRLGILTDGSCSSLKLSNEFQGNSAPCGVAAWAGPPNHP